MRLADEKRSLKSSAFDDEKEAAQLLSFPAGRKYVDASDAIEKVWEGAAKWQKTRSVPVRREAGLLASGYGNASEAIAHGCHDVARRAQEAVAEVGALPCWLGATRILPWLIAAQVPKEARGR